MQLAGAPTPIVENVSSFSVSSRGELAYQVTSGASSGAELVWKDRSGRVRRRIEQASGASRPALSPDGHRIAMMLRGDIWVYETDRDLMNRVTLAARGESPDGIRPAMHPHWRRCFSFTYGWIFSVVAPCHWGASPVSVLAGTFTTGC